MTTLTAVRSIVSVLSALALAASCAGPSERSESVEQVDQLLTHIERVQAETAVAKSAARAALDGLCVVVSPSFQGDAASAFAKFIAACEASEQQGEALRDAAEPMQDAAAELFHRWTKDMEAFGNSRMRQRSQTRLDETRTRFQSIVGAAQAAQIALDAFHDDLEDHALFLRHDLNSASVASIRGDVRQLNEEVQNLDTRFDATVAAARAYVESAALYGQVETEAAAEETTAPSATAKPAEPTEPAPKKRTVTTLKPKSAKTSTTSTTTTTPSTTTSETPAPPVEEPAPTPAPTPEIPGKPKN